MDYTIITIQGTESELLNLQSKLTDPDCKVFNYRGVFQVPTWVNLAPKEEVWLVDNLTNAQKMALDKAIRSISLNTTFRTWAVTALEKCCEIIADPWATKRRPAFDINHTIFNVKACDLYDELDRQISIRRKTIEEIFSPEIALVINFFLCQQLETLTGFRSKDQWLAGSAGNVISGTVIETDFRYDGRSSDISYVVQTLGGTPWTFFKTLSAHFPELRFIVSDVDTGHSIIQMKIYHRGKIVTTLTTEETSTVKHMDIHTSRAFGGVYFYLPLTG